MKFLFKLEKKKRKLKHLKCYRKYVEKRLCEQHLFLGGVNVFPMEGMKLSLCGGMHYVCVLCYTRDPEIVTLN
jgi:hypothetical protein